MLRAWTLVLAGLLAASCDHLRTESRDYGVTFKDFTRVPGPPPYLVLAGTELCRAEARCGPCEEEPKICEGVALAVEGAEQHGDACHTVELGAPLTYTFTPQGCTSSIPAESLFVDAVVGGEVSARFNPSTTGSGEADDLELPVRIQGAALPEPAVYSPLQLLAGASVEVGVTLTEDTSQRVVGWNPVAGALELEALAGDAPAVSGKAHALTFTAAAGSRARASLSLLGFDYALGDVVAVGPEAIDHLEITAIFIDDGANGEFPFQVEAHALDAAGKHILGLPIEWQVLAGSLVTESEPDRRIGEVISVSDCAPRKASATRSGVIEAAYGEHRAQLELSWKTYTGDERFVGSCDDEGCGCREGTPGGAAGLGLGLFALALRRKRRSARPA